MKSSLTRHILSLTLIFLFCKSETYAQSGDQILDGIGETGLIARYIFDGNAKDWSRNNLHATLQDNTETYVTDERFKNVLSLANENYLTLPKETLNGIESLTITTWIYLNAIEKNQYLFDFGSTDDSHFFATPKAKKTGEFSATLVKNAVSIAVN